jgi:peptidoglycan/LPS O-acetylase OafA/YrhL
VSSSAGASVGPPERGTPRRFDIELLRVVAVVGVVLFHFSPGSSLVPHGFLGVDIFFTISGFVITAQLVRAWERGRLTYTDFLARRVRRLLPSAVLVIVATYVVVLLSRNVIMIDSQRSVAIAALLYASNFVFAAQSLDYFASVDAPSPFLHYWSLSVEEQFYLVWPVLLIAVAVATRRRPDRFRRSLLVVALGLAVVSLVVAAVSMRTAPEQTFFMPWARAHQLLIGAAAAIVAAAAGRPALPGVLLGPLRVAAIGLLVALQLLPVDLGSPGPAALLISVPVAFIALTGSGTDLLSRVGGWWPMAWTARLSYVIYLWHWPVWTIVLQRLTDLRGREQIAVAALITLVLSVVTHLTVEQPFRDGRRIRALPPLRTAVLGLGSSVLAAVVVLGAAAFAPAPPWQQTVRPHITELATDRSDLYGRKCLTAPRDTDVTACADGDLRADTTVLMMGDSYSVSWHPAFQSLAWEGRWRYVSLTKASCPAWDVPIAASSGGVRYTECEQWRRGALARIATVRPDIVVLHSRNTWTQLLDADGRPAADRAAALSRGVTSTVTAARRSGATVVVLLDIPLALGMETGQRVQDCLATARDPADCSFPSRRDAPQRAVVRRAAAAAGAVTVDPYPVICPEAECRAVQDRIAVYRDSGHLTKTYALHQRPWVRSWLGPLLPGR